MVDKKEGFEGRRRKQRMVKEEETKTMPKYQQCTRTHRGESIKARTSPLLCAPHEMWSVA